MVRDAVQRKTISRASFLFATANSGARRLGNTVICAADGAVGLKILRSSGRCDLLITDVALSNGTKRWQVADADRAIRPRLKILFISGHAENAAVGNGHLEPGMELQTKPFWL